MEVTGDTSQISSGSQTSPSQTSIGSLDPDLVAVLTGHLTECIGPVARVLVKREVAAGGGLTDVAQRLAVQIPDTSARQRFLSLAARLG